RGDDEDAAGRLQGAQHAGDVLALDRREPEAVEHADRLVAELGRERAAESQPAHLARQPLLVRARVRPEHGATAAVVRRGARALAGAARALLAVRLLAAAADLAARLGVVGADPPAGELGRDDLVQDRLVHRRAEEPVVQLDAADVGPGAVEEGCRRHRSGLPDHDQAAPGARQAALDQQEVLAGVGADDADLLGRDLLVAHVAGHAHALVDATWGRARADRAGLAMVVGAVGRGTAVEVVALHVAR